MNQDRNLRHQQNKFTLIYQFIYNLYHHNTVDIILMFNKILLIAIELKNQYNQYIRQTVGNSK